MTELNFFNDTNAVITDARGESSMYNVLIDVEAHNGTEYISMGYQCEEDTIMFTKAEAEHLQAYLAKVIPTMK